MLSNLHGLWVRLLGAAVLVSVVWWNLSEVLNWSPVVLTGRPDEALELSFELIQPSAIWILLVLLMTGLFDAAIQQLSFQRRLRMTRDELDRELHETEGRPELRGERRRLHQEIALESIVLRVRRAKVIIVAPAEYADPSAYGRQGDLA